jgi:hypothetical protein
MLKRRGRPPRAAAQVDDDRVIALCVDQLLAWGFSGSGEAYEAVGIAARDVLGRVSSEGGALGPDSVKKLHEKLGPPGWERFWPDAMRQAVRPFSRHRIWSNPSLRARAPAGTVDELARTLLHHGGAWPHDEIYQGEPEPTAKWAGEQSQGLRVKK